MPEKDQAAKRPSHYAYQVNEGQDGKSYFNRVGAAFEHKDKEGFSVVLDSVPVDGRVTLRSPKERLDQMRSGPKAEADKEAKPAPQNERDIER